MVIGVLSLLGNSLLFKFVVLDADWGNRLLDRVIQVSSVGAAFWGVAITLLIGMENRPVVVRLRKLGYYKVVVRYFGESLFASFVLLFLSVLLEPLTKLFSASALSGLWMGAGAWAIASTFRTYSVLTNLLIRTAEE